MMLGMCFSCHKKSTTTKVTSKITFIKQIDSLPSLLNIEYTDITNGTNKQQITSNTIIEHDLRFDETVTLTATAIKNVSQINIEITTNSETNNKSCSGNDCTVSLRKNIYD